jgi:DNA-binding NtrC family response regulator
MEDVELPGPIMSVIIKKNVLMLDSNRHILDALSKNLYFYLKNCNIMTVESCAKVDEVLRSTPIDVIVADLDVQADDSYHFIERIKKDHPRIGLCVMSGKCTPAMRRRLKDAGIVSYLEKPFLLPTLAAMISDELERADSGSSADASRE